MSEYLAIKNWGKYQSGKKGWDWIKDYVNQNDDDELSGLSMFERGLLQELRRLRGRSGKNIKNSVTHIAGAIHAKVTDRPHIRHAIDTLIARGILVLTNQQDDFVDEMRRDEIRGDEETPKTQARKAPAKQPVKPQEVRTEASSVQVMMYLPLNNGEEFGITPEDFALWKQCYPAVDVMQQLRAMVAWCHANTTRRKTRTGVKKFINSWLARAQDNPRGAQEFSNGRTQSISKADAREQRILERAARFASSTQSTGGINHQGSVPLALPGNGGSGVCGLAGDPELIPPERSSTSPRQNHAAAAKAGST